MLRIEAFQTAALRKQFLAEWLIQSFDGSPQAAQLEEATGGVLLSDSRGNATRFSFDEHGYIGRVRSPTGRDFSFVNDESGRVIHSDAPTGLRISSDYDARGRLRAVRRGPHPFFNLDYDSGDYVREIVFPDGTTARLAWSEQGEVTEVVNRLGVLEKYDRDEDGRIIAVQDGRGHRMEFSYGSWDRPDAAIHPDGGTEKYEFDPNGFLSRLTWPGSRQLDVQNADNGLPLRITDDGDEVDIAFAYDSDTRVTAARAGKETLSYAYDADGRVVREDAPGNSVEYRYDPAGTLVGMRYPDGAWVEFEHDADLRLSRIRDWTGAIHELRYTADDRRMELRAANGLITTTTRTTAGSPSSITVSKGERIRREIFSLRYTYDSEDRVTGIVDSEHEARTFEYDAESQLIAVRADSPGRNERFSYDAAGNRTQAGPHRCPVDECNRLLQLGDARLRYDLRGNLAEIARPNGTWTYRYDARNQLTFAAHTDGRQVSFAYDAFGRRIRKSTPDREVRFTWAGESLIRETTRENGKLRTQDFLYYPGTCTPFATRIDGKVYLYHTDHLGTPIRLTDATGQLAWDADYSAFGEAEIAREEIVNPLRLPGQYFDSETGLHYNRFRYYSPELGRYITRDPISVLGGLNLYRYADNDPINSADPTGLWKWKSVLPIVGGILAGVAVGAAMVALAPAVLPLAVIAAGVAAGAVGAGLNEALNQDHLCIPCILKAAAKGGLIGGIASLPFAFLPIAAGVGPYAAAGGASGALGHIAGYLADSPRGPWNWGQFATSVAVGAATAGAARYISTRWSAPPQTPNTVASQLARNRQIGLEGERRVGLIKNTQRIPSTTRPGTYRIPDGLNNTTISEVKNVARLGYTRQLQDFAAFAKNEGRIFDLYVKPTTQLSKPLQNAVRQGLIKLKFIP